MWQGDSLKGAIRRGNGEGAAEDKKLLQTIRIGITCARTNFGVLAFFYINGGRFTWRVFYAPTYGGGREEGGLGQVFFFFAGTI